MKVSRSGRDSHEVVVKLRPRLRDAEVDSLRPSMIGGGDESGLNSRNSGPVVENGDRDELLQLRAEVKKLKAGLEKAVQINEKMWSGIVDMQIEGKPDGT